MQIEGPAKEVQSLLNGIPEMVEVHMNRTVEKNVTEFELNAKEGADIRRERKRREKLSRNQPEKADWACQRELVGFLTLIVRHGTHG